MTDQESKFQNLRKLDKLRTTIERGIKQCEQGEVRLAGEVLKTVRSRLKSFI